MIGWQGQFGFKYFNALPYLHLNNIILSIKIFVYRIQPLHTKLRNISSESGNFTLKNPLEKVVKNVTIKGKIRTK